VAAVVEGVNQPWAGAEQQALSREALAPWAMQGRGGSLRL